jgi:hypothetical protein
MHVFPFGAGVRVLDGITNELSMEEIIDNDGFCVLARAERLAVLADRRG